MKTRADGAEIGEPAEAHDAEHDEPEPGKPERDQHEAGNAGRRQKEKGRGIRCTGNQGDSGPSGADKCATRTRPHNAPSEPLKAPERQRRPDCQHAPDPPRQPGRVVGLADEVLPDLKPAFPKASAG